MVRAHFAFKKSAKVSTLKQKRLIRDSMVALAIRKRRRKPKVKTSENRCHVRMQSMHRVLMHGLHVLALKLPRATNEENHYLCYSVSARHQIMQRKISKVMEVRN